MHPLELRGWLFDLDGVLTDTARVHVAAWKETFDQLLERLARDGRLSAEQARPFDPVQDYLRYVDGKPRDDGVRDFLASRGVTLPEGERQDPAEAVSVHGVGNDKNARFLGLLGRQGVEVFPGSARFVRALVGAGRSTGVVSSSENCRSILEAGGLTGLFWVVVDGELSRQQGLQGKPAPDTFVYGASLLGLAPAAVAVVEDSPAGVAAGRAGDFGYVVGVARRAAPAELIEAGADVVVGDLDDFATFVRLLEHWSRQLV